MSLPEYTVRYSKKAKYLQMRVSIRGLEVVVPLKRKWGDQFIENFLASKRAWIEKNWQRFLENKKQPVSNIQLLPTHIDLKAMQQVWQVKYLPSKRLSLRILSNPSNEITLIGDIANEELCVVKLKKWLKQIAIHFLYEELSILSRETGLFFNRVSIRNNISRWGSCSSSRNISLCCRLLFLPPLLMRHVLLHELCHTRVMHHGKAFWKLLEQVDTHALYHAKALKTAGAEVPWWVTSE